MCISKNAIKVLCALLITFVFIIGCSQNENNMGSSPSSASVAKESNAIVQTENSKQTIPEEPLTYEDIKQAMDQFRDGWKLEEDSTVLSQYYNSYTFLSPENFTCNFTTSTEKGAFHIESLVFFPPDTVGLIPDFNNEDLPKLLDLMCELYGDINIHDFDDFWDFFSSDNDLIWRKEIGDNEIKIELKEYNIGDPEPITTVFIISVSKKDWTDISDIRVIKSTLWGDQVISLEENVSTTDAIAKNTATPTKSCYIIKGEIINVKKLDSKPELPTTSEIFFDLNRTFDFPYNNTYSSIKIADSSGEIDVIVPVSLNESEGEDYKYFLVYEYVTDEGRAYLLLRVARSNPEEK